MENNELYNFKNIKIKDEIGRGSYGIVYSGILKESDERVAVKLDRTGYGRLEHEFMVLRSLNYQIGFPKVFYRGKHRFGVGLVMEELGKSLHDLFTSDKRAFTYKKISQIAVQCIERIRALHEIGIVHRDIKPSNLMTGLKDENIIYLIDFGLSKNYIKDNKHILLEKTSGNAGTLAFMSTHSHQHIVNSRRDDLESLGYVLLYFMRRGLPWKTDSNKSLEWNSLNFFKRKMEVILVCDTLDIKRYFAYVRSLGFEDKPDYDYLSSLFQPEITKTQSS